MTGPDLTALGQPLDANRVRQRTDGRGGKLSYLETHDVIRRANEVFGFGRWGHEVVDLRPLPPVTVHNKDKKPGVCVGYICTVRLTVEGCVPVSGVGFGDATEYRESAGVTAHELAAKEAESDALKRALKNYGDQFGLALYDKDAATSGHVVAASPEPKATDQSLTQEEERALLEVAQRYAERVPEFRTGTGGGTLADLKKRIAENRGDRAWFVSTTASLKSALESAPAAVEAAAAEAGFPLPEDPGKFTAPQGKAA